jgi:hypothetical protein
MGSLQLLMQDPGMNQQERSEVVAGAYDCGESLLQTLNGILTIAKVRTRATFAVEVLKVPYSASHFCTCTLQAPQSSVNCAHVSTKQGWCHRSTSVL